MVAHTCNPSIWEAETGVFTFTARLSYLDFPNLVRPCFKIKNKKNWAGGLAWS